MKNVNWTTIIVALVLVAGVVTITVAGKEVPDVIKGAYASLAIILAAMLREALGPKAPPPPPQVTP